MIIKLKYIFTHKTFLILLFIINLFGTIYGYLWYAGQLAITPAVFIPFVPDSPTATLFFTIFLIFFIFRSEEHTSELQSRGHLVCRLLLEKKKDMQKRNRYRTGSRWGGARFFR